MTVPAGQERVVYVTVTRPNYPCYVVAHSDRYEKVEEADESNNLAQRMISW